MSDEIREFVARSLRGDQDAIAALVECFRGPVFGLCYRMLGNRHDAEDVAQETFLRAFRSLAGFDATRDFRAWLLAIAGNRCRTRLGARRRQFPPLAVMGDVPDPRADEAPGRHLAEEVALVLAEIREEYRRAFLLFHADQLSYQEIAEALDVPLGTVKTWVYRARRELAERLRARGVVEELPDALH